tara:strand:+ start:140 stop:250 length:111 start_codon:yes stop_codon:yes gene_type:complete
VVLEWSKEFITKKSYELNLWFFFGLNFVAHKNVLSN